MICNERFREKDSICNGITEDEINDLFSKIRFLKIQDNHEQFVAEQSKPSRLSYAYQEYLSYCEKYNIDENNRLGLDELIELYGNTNTEILYNPRLYDI